MKLTKAVFFVCFLLSLRMSFAGPASPHTVKAVVITPDGTVVPEFSITVKQVADKPQLVQRKHFKDGKFTVDHLNPNKYELLISAPTFIDAKVIFDFANRPRDTDYSIVILHQFRNE